MTDQVNEHDLESGCLDCLLNVPDGHEDLYCLGGAESVAMSLSGPNPAPSDCPLRHGDVVFRGVNANAETVKS